MLSYVSVPVYDKDGKIIEYDKINIKNLPKSIKIAEIEEINNLLVDNIKKLEI
jgi:hypothetical protein